jgi:glycine betaine/proline transport system substrate-binding protein
MSQKNKIPMKIKTLYFCFFTLIIVSAGCNIKQQADTQEERKVNIVYTDWSEAVALTNLSKILLEEKMEYEVVTKLTDVESAYQEVASGQAHVFPDAWLPETHSHYFEEYGNNLQKLSVIYPGARTGLVVPEYSNYQSVEDLVNLEMNILGIDTGAGVMRQTRQAIELYDLTGVRLQNLSEQEMTRQFSEAYKRRNEVVITGWEPHWLFARYEVRFLEDPREVYGHMDNIFALGTNNLEKEHPHVVRFFERMQLSEDQINQLIYFMNQDDDPEVGIREWIDKNEYIVNQWVKDLKPEREKIM